MLIGKRDTWMLFGSLAVAMLVAAILAVWAPQLPAATAAGNAAVSPSPETPTTEICLGCHGPFDALAKRTAGYVTDKSEKVNPHTYVPHASNKITTCTDCHEAHLLPVTSPGITPKANVQYCYSACHHKNDFTPCVECHKDKK